MSWQDRDYAKAPNYGRGSAAGGFGAPFRGSRIVKVLITVNVVIFALGALSRPLGDLLFQLGAMQTDAVLRGQVWRLITAQYLHAGIMHILLNMVGLYFLGKPIERMWSAKRFFVVYTLCGIMGNLFFTMLGWRGVIDPMVPAVGASGCVLGLLGILAVRFPTATIYAFPFPFPLKIRTLALIVTGIAFFSIIERSHNFGGEACHLAGLAFGAWWAWRGEAWWAQTEWRLPRFRTRRAHRHAHSTGGFTQRVAQRRADAETIDRILRKVYDGGVHTLSESEKRALKEATDRQRAEEQGAERLDRL